LRKCEKEGEGVKSSDGGWRQGQFFGKGTRFFSGVGRLYGKWGAQRETGSWREAAEGEKLKFKRKTEGERRGRGQVRAAKD